MDLFKYLYNIINSEVFLEWTNRIILLSDSIIEEKFILDMNNVYGIQYIIISLKNIAEITPESVILNFYVNNSYFDKQYDLYNKLTSEYQEYFKNTKVRIYLSELDSSLDSLIINYISLTKNQYNFINVSISNMNLYFVNEKNFYNFLYRLEEKRGLNINSCLSIDMRMYLIGEIYLSENGYIDPSCNLRLYNGNRMG